MDKYWSDWKFSGIYAIVHAPSGKRYVGQAIDVSKRVERHMHYHKWTSRHLSSAIKLYGIEQFEAIVLEMVADRTELNAREQWWMNALGATNPDTGYNMRPDAYSQSGYKMSDEARAKMRSSAKRRWENPEHYAKFMETQRDPEFLAARSARGKKHYESEEAREKQRIASKKAYENPEAREKNRVASKKAYENPEAREKNRVASKKYLESPENYARLLEICRAPEYRAKMSESMKRRWENPEAREKQSMAQKAAWAKRRAAKQEVVV